MAQQGLAKKTVWFDKFGGVQQVDNTRSIKPGMWANLLNYEVNRAGAFAPRTGMELFSPSKPPDGLAPRTIFAADMDGVIYILVATDEHVYSYDYSLATWSLVYPAIGAFSTVGKRVLFDILTTNVNPIVVFGNGSFPLQKWTTGLSTACTGAPAGRPVSWQNYLCMFDIPGSPGMVQFSYYPGDPDTWDVAGQVKSLNVTGTVTSLCIFNNLVIFTPSKTYQQFGDPDQPGMVVTLSNSIGCFKHESVRDCGGILTWLSSAGIHMWSGSGPFPTELISSPKSSDASRLDDDVRKFAWDLPEYICSAYSPIDQSYFLGIRLRTIAGGTATPMVYKFDFTNGQWFPWSVNAICMEMAILPFPVTGNLQPLLLSASSNGSFRYWDFKDFIDKEVVVAQNDQYTFTARSGDWNMGNPDVSKTFRAIIISTTAKISNIPTGNRTIKIYYRGDFDRFISDLTTASIMQAGFILGVGILGTTALTTAKRFYEKRIPIALRSKYLQLVITGSGKGEAIPISAIGTEVIGGPTREILVDGD